MNQRFAILDLGTNTFHLLMVDVRDDRSFQVIYKAEEFVQLGENGLDEIGEKPFSRGLQQIRKYKEVIDQLQPQQIIAFGTAAIRRASNGDDFVQQIKSICPMEVRKISGDEEAALICLGVRQAVKLNEEPVLIMDIGGGSTEFIIANKDQLFWKQSFPAGASVLKQQFHHHEPIAVTEREHLKSFLKEVLQPLFLKRDDFNITHLVGASGSFDTFAKMISYRFYKVEISKEKTFFDFTPEQFHIMYQQLIRSNLEQRLAMQGMKAFRAGMITVGAVLTEVVLQYFNIQKITQSAYALKEGVLWKMIQNEKV
ncbi:MAG TPA: hypothetical protein PLD84_02210 [Chitinophagales bacterium]|nr:hypothetical protein [Chitinophagales bacterium]